VRTRGFEETSGDAHIGDVPLRCERVQLHVRRFLGFDCLSWHLAACKASAPSTAAAPVTGHRDRHPVVLQTRRVPTQPTRKVESPNTILRRCRYEGTVTEEQQAVDFKLSVLDVSPVSSGSSGAQALHNTLDLARLADRLGATSATGWPSTTTSPASQAPHLRS